MRTSRVYEGDEGVLTVNALWVVLPAYNEAAGLGATLSALEAQSDTDFTLCVVDNASTDDTARIAEQFAGRAPFRVVVLDEPMKGVGSAVDTGFRRAITEGAAWLARTDADTIPDPDWIRQVKSALCSGTELAVGSMRARPDQTGVLGRIGFRIAVVVAASFGRLRPEHRGQGTARYVMHAGFNMAVTADLYVRSGGMPRRPSPTDRTFMNRVRAVGGIVRRHRSMRAATSLRRFDALGVVGTAHWYLDRGAHTEDPR